MKFKSTASSNQSTLRRYAFIAIILVLVLSVACNLQLSNLLRNPASSDQSSGPPPDQPEQKNDQDSSAAAEQTVTPTPVTPTATLTPTTSATPTQTTTPTPYVIISGNTHCRFGPGSIYDLLHTYLSGEQALLLGKNQDETFWYTQDQSGINPDCWLWGKFATPVGNTTALPIFTPPPTPTPYMNYSVNYEGSDCGAGSCGFWFKVDNTGTMPLESVRVYVENVNTSANSTYTSNVFLTGIMGSDIASIPFTSSGYTRSNLIPNPVGNKVSASIKICSQNSLGGICLTKTLTINP